MAQNLKIAFLAPIKRPILADTTVSRNRVIVDLASELVRRGHKVSIIGSADSSLPNVEIIGVVPKSLNFLPAAENPFYQHTAYLTMMIEELAKRQDGFDLVHNHMYPEFLPLLALQSFKIPLLTTVHSQMTQEMSGVLSYFREAHLVAISGSAQKASGLPMTVVHNSVDTDFFLPAEGTKDYFLFVGRMSKAKDKDGKFIDPKGVQNAIAVARKTNIRLKIVGNVEDPKFFDELIKPHLSDTIEFIGEVSAEQKMTREEMRDLFAGAIALVNPINWEEPFGLVMAEALSCGTPVIAFNRGAVSEIVIDSKVGFVIDPISQIQNSKFKIQKTGIDGFIEAIGKIENIDRQACRDHAVTNFSKKRMVDDYERMYYNLLGL